MTNITISSFFTARYLVSTSYSGPPPLIYKLCEILGFDFFFEIRSVNFRKSLPKMRHSTGILGHPNFNRHHSVPPFNNHVLTHGPHMPIRVAPLAALVPFFHPSSLPPAVFGCCCFLVLDFSYFLSFIFIMFCCCISCC